MSVKRELVWGTFILTAAGFAARILGMYNRIYLANLISNAELGRYQLIFPVFMLCMAISSTGIQVALSKMVAAFHASGRKKETQLAVVMAMVWSLGLACVCSGFLFVFSDWIAVHILKESACGPYLRIMAFALPFAALHTCVSGYFYGCRKAGVPAAAQLLEQIARVGCIYGLSVIIYGTHPADASIAVYGLVAGETVSCVLTIVCYKADMHRWQRDASMADHMVSRLFHQLWQYAGLLTMNRVSVTLLQSAEMILIPLMLTRYCGDSVQALELFGVMTGIVMPIIAFPNTVTNALSTMLLPTVSEAEAVHNYRAIADTFEKSICYCLMMGIFVSLLFAVYGGQIGLLLFDDANAGCYIRMFAILCPLMYIQSLLAGTLNGFGKMNETLMHHVIASGIRIAGILLLIPRMGIAGYMIGIFISNVIVTAIAAFRMRQLADVRLSMVKCLLVPACAAVLSAQISIWSGKITVLLSLPGNAVFWQLVWQCGIMGVIYMCLILPWTGLTLKNR